MARVYSGILGPVSGKVGNLVFYISRRKNFVRSAPRKSLMAPSLKQRIQRTRFGEAIRFISPLSKLINESYKAVNRYRAGTNVLVKEIPKDSILGKYPNFMIDYSSVNLIRGNLEGIDCKMSYEVGSKRFDLCWTVFAQPEHLDDELIVMAYLSFSETWIIAPARATRAQAGCTVHFETLLEMDCLHIWIAFRSPDQKNFSDSQYMGEINYDAQSYEE
jgi:hypothetical protein